MKTYRYCHPQLNLDISMPDIIFWFFKRYAKIKALQAEPLQGRSLNFVVLDEAQELQPRGGVMSSELKQAYRSIAESLEVAARELELKATILRRINGSLWHQASDSSNPDAIHSINPENLFSTIRNAILEYEKYK